VKGKISRNRTTAEGRVGAALLPGDRGVEISFMKVVVTGGAGFIGSNLAGELLKKHDVTVVDNLSTGRMDNLDYIRDEIEFIQGSITDLDLLKKAFISADTVFHQAAIPSVQRSVDNPIVSNEANVDGTLKVLVAARDCGVRKVVYASSSSVYGDTPTLPKREDMKPNPKSPYAVSKLAGEYYCRVFSEVYGLETACLRYFNVYGPRQDPKSQYAAVIPRFVTRVLDHEPPVIFGDGTQTRDFTFVKDVVKANILAMESEAEGVFNIACGHRVSLNELAGKIMEITGIRLDPIYDKPRPGDIKDSLADISSARDKLGYEPEFNLNSGLEGTIKWFQKN
jgi:UDP-glucose 4-epimerase